MPGLMRFTKQDAAYATLGVASVAALASAARGNLQRWVGLDLATVIVIVALVSTAFACQHVLLMALVALAERHVQPILWLVGRSRAAIRAMLHLSALTIFAVGVPLGFALSSNLVLAIATVLAVTIGLAAEWTFMGGMGPLASLLRERERSVEQFNGN